MANIKNFIQHPGAVYNDNSLTINAQQNNTQVNNPTSSPIANDANITKNSPKIKFNAKRPNKINLYRVILTLQREGFFFDQTGQIASQEDVFTAFSQMLGEDFSDFHKNLSEGVKPTKIATKSIFKALEESWENYRNECLEN